MSSTTNPVYLETAKTRVFAIVPAWPGWCRGARSADAALQALVDYVPRYTLALQGVDLVFPSINSVADLQVVASLPGNAVTDFGAPDRPLPGDELPVDAPELERMRTFLHVAWRAFDRAVQAARGKSLRTGPRGGGRDLDKMIEHVRGGQQAYLTALGGKLNPGGSDTDLRLEILETLAASVRGEIPALGPRGGKRWTPRYFVRRSAWHALDHAWELEDRAG